MARQTKWNSRHIQETRARAKLLRDARKSKDWRLDLKAQIRLARVHLAPDVLRDDADVHGEAWPEYGYMTAYERTEQFTRDYAKAYMRIHEKYFDFHVAEGMQPIAVQFEMNDVSEMTSLWKARQVADALGVPYPFFIRVAMDEAVQQRGYRQVPRPNQLTLNWQVEAVSREWKVDKDTYPIFSDDWDPRFFAPSARKDRARSVAVGLFLSRVKPATAGSETVRSAIFMRQILSEEEAREHFKGEAVDRALADPTSATIVLRTDVGPGYKPACLGLLKDRDAGACGSCKASAACAVVCAVVDKDLQATYGATDPRLRRIREGAAERQRRSRARRREAALLGARVTEAD